MLLDDAGKRPVLINRWMPTQKMSLRQKST
jgi:hypothetical protein